MLINTYLQAAVDAARAAGVLLRENFGTVLDVNEFAAHDIKLDLDVRSQELIANLLLSRFPDHAFLGEEGGGGPITGNPAAVGEAQYGTDFQWIVDPIDGTVNYFYGIPHFCISIALRHLNEMVVGVIYDPMRDELWQTARGEAALLNGKPIAVSARTRLADAVLSVGFSKTATTIAAGLPMLEKYVQRARKCRLMGSAALDLAYVACGRLDAYIEQAVSLWDVAAGQLLVQNAGGQFEMTPLADNPAKISVVASSGRIDLELETPLRR